MSGGCDELRRFWGIPASASANVVVHESERTPGEPVTLELEDELRPPWLASGTGVRVWLAERPRASEPDERALAWFVSGEDRRPAAVRQRGGVAFRYDPDAMIAAVLDESYLTPRRPLHTRLPVPYQWVPGDWRLRVFELLARRPENETGFPEWPVERSVETVRWAYRRAVELSSGFAVGSSRWPHGRRYAVAVSHDVDTAAGLAAAPELAAFDAALGMRSTWFVVGALLASRGPEADALRRHGHEIGLHGDRHDNRLPYVGHEAMTRRIESCLPLVRQFSIEGFRAPSLLESPALREILAGAFSYASDIPDTEVSSLIAPRRGCGSAFPFVRGGLLEIPITLPFEDKLLIAGCDEAGIVGLWRRKLEWAREVGGLAQLAVHCEPHLLRRCRGAYETLARELAEDEEAWHAPLGEIARWWRESGRA